MSLIKLVLITVTTTSGSGISCLHMMKYFRENGYHVEIWDKDKINHNFKKNLFERSFEKLIIKAESFLNRLIFKSKNIGSFNLVNNKKFIQFLNNNDYEYIIIHWFNGVLKRKDIINLNKKKILILHDQFFFQNYFFQPYKKSFFKNNRFYKKKFDDILFISPSKFLADQVINQNIKVIDNFSNFKDNAFKENINADIHKEIKIEKNRYNLIIANNILSDLRKGGMKFLDYIYENKIKNYKLYIVGEQNLDLLNLQIKRFKEFNITFIKKSNNALAKLFIKNANYLIVPSLYENAPLVIYEAYFFNTPVIGLNHTGLAETIKRVNGKLVEPDDYKEIIKITSKLKKKHKTEHKNDTFFNISNKIAFDKYDKIFKKYLSKKYFN